jgi:hypothetical protein
MVNDATLHSAQPEFPKTGRRSESQLGNANTISPKRITKRACTSHRETWGSLISYLVPSEFVAKMVDAGESKIFMSTRDTVIRAYMAGAILALAAWFAVTVNVHTSQPTVGALLFPVGFCMPYLLGFDLLTGVFALSPLAFVGSLRLAARELLLSAGPRRYRFGTERPHKIGGSRKS